VNDPDAEVRLERDRAAAESLSAEAQGQLNESRRELVARREGAASAAKLVASLEERICASDKRVAELRARERASKRRLGKVRERLRRTQRQLARARTRARRAEQRLGQMTASRTYRLAGRLMTPGRAWSRSKQALRQRQRNAS